MDFELLKDYELRPSEVVRTLTRDWNGEKLSTPTASGETPLFSVWEQGEALVLEWPLGRHTLKRAEVEEATLGLLWESASDICRHMEVDHQDTFKEFLRLRGWIGSEELPTVMPWIEERGFFLSNPELLAWIPFPQPCSTPNEVRKTLIKMLREIRHVRP